MDVISSALVKIAEISLHGVSPESALGQMAPAPPMETSGLAKAMAILARYNAETGPEKMASPSVSPALAPGLNTLSGAKKDKKDRTMVGETKSLGAHVIGGGAAGRMAGWATARHLPTSEAAKALHHSRQWKGMMAGAAIGGAEFGRKRLVEAYRRHKEKTSAVAAISSPKIALKASQQTGKIFSGIKKGPAPSLSTQVRGSKI
jgi:hypothetical protein